MTRRRVWGELLVVAALGAAGFAAWAWAAGQDANWDLQNYHRYAAYALLHWRYPLEVGAGGFQSYLNPLPYVLPYALGTVLAPLPAGIVLAVLQSAVVPILWALAGALLPGRGVLVRGCATAAAVCSATAIAEVGTSFADLPLSILVLGGLLALVRRPAWGGAVLAGVLIGAAAGLKLTGLVFGPALLAACLASPGGWRRRCGRAVASGGGFVVGAALTGGAWSWYLWRTYGNPVFPGLNSVFRSPSAAISDFTERGFLPHGWLDALSYPARIAWGLHPTAEAAFREPRLLAFVAAAAAAAILRPPRLAGAFWFTGVSGALWLGLFAIERYAVPIEMLAGLLTVAVAAELPGRRRAVPVLAAGLLLLATRPSDWWHRPWAQAYVPTLPRGVMQPAGFVVVSYPNGYWGAALDPASRIYGIPPIGLATGGVLRRLLDAGLAAPPGQRLWTVGADIPMAMDVRAALAAHGFVPSAPCLRAPSLWFVDTVFCRLVPADPRIDAAADLAPGTPVSFTKAGAGWIYETGRWSEAGPVGTAILASTAGLVFRVDAQSQSPVLTLDFAQGAAGIEASSGGLALKVERPGVGLDVVCMPPSSGVVAIGLRRITPVAILRAMTLRAARPGECGQ